MNYFIKHQCRLGFFMSLFIWCFVAKAQSDSTSHRKPVVIGTLGGLYAGSMAGLYALWYADYPQSNFHTINDNTQWLKMDKAGHVFSTYIEGHYATNMLKWAGFSDYHSSVYGPLYGLIYQSTFEILDGFSSEWGASGGDIAANFIGASLLTSQALLWKEQRLTMKFSYSPTPFAKQRPEVLGANAIQSIFKDYNGQTYWLCISPKLFAPKSQWPSWLDISLGYGATGMYGGTHNIWLNKDPNPKFNDFSSTPRRAIFYLSPDINLDKIKTRKKWLRYSFKILNTFKFPLPALSFSEGSGFKFSPLKF